MCGVSGTECIALSDEVFGGFGEVRDTVGDETSGDVVFGCCEEDPAELGFTSTCRGRHFEISEGFLGFPGE